jgi:CPA2 family monovalent cation:H+ antiporter-2
LPEDGRGLIIAGAIITILLNPLLFAALDVYAARREKAIAEEAAAQPEEEEAPMREPIRPTNLKDHVVLVGHGRVGSFISSVLRERKVPLFVIEDDEDAVAALREQGIEALAGNAADPEVIPAANLPEARCLLVAIPDAFEGGQVVQQARAINPTLPIIARAHSEEEIEHLKRHGATLVVMGEHEIARAMLDNVAEVAALAEQAASAPRELAEKPATAS